MNNNHWQIEYLIKEAFKRTKNRFLSYFLGSILSLLINGTVILGFLLFIGILALIFSLTHAILPILLLGFIGLNFFIIMLIYVSTWTRLAIVKIVIQKETKGLMQSFKETKTYVWGFFWYGVLSTLFMLLLFPLFPFSLFIVAVLWSFWSSFVIFIYLEKKKKGLDNLWMSKEMVNQKFWGIAGRMILVQAAILFISLLLISTRNTIVGFSVSIFQFIVAPFVINFNYLMYQNLEEPKELKKPVGWLVAGIIGWLLLIVICVTVLPGLLRGKSGQTLPFRYTPSRNYNP